MRKDILLFLASFADNDYHELNRFLQKNFGDNLRNTRSALTYLEEKNQIEIMEGSIWPEQDSAEAGSWQVSARITTTGREELNKEESSRIKRNVSSGSQSVVTKNWWETEAARKQFLDYSKLKKQSSMAIYIALTTIVLTLILESLRWLGVL